jgi:hypothetical protein
MAGIPCIYIKSKALGDVVANSINENSINVRTRICQAG